MLSHGVPLPWQRLLIQSHLELGPAFSPAVYTQARPKGFNAFLSSRPNPISSLCPRHPRKISPSSSPVPVPRVSLDPTPWRLPSIPWGLGGQADGHLPAATDLLEKMLELDVDKRLTASQALAHPFFEPFRDPEEETEAQQPFDDSLEHEKLTVDEWKRKCCTASFLSCQALGDPPVPRLLPQCQGIISRTFSFSLN